MDGWMYGLRIELMAMAMATAMVTIAANTSSTEAIQFTARAGSPLAFTAVTAAYATAAASPFIYK